MTAPDAPWTSPDGTLLGYDVWAPDGKPKAVVLALHGLGCRARDFAPLGENLAGNGITLAAWNLRGQGLDPEVARRGAWLDAAGHLADLRAFQEFLALPDVPLFLCGESMGTLLVLRAAIDRRWSERVAGVLLFSPVVALARETPGWLVAVLKAMARVLPGLRIRPGWFVHGRRGMPKLTRVEERQLYLETAPHRLGPLTLDFLLRIGDMIETAADDATRLDLPVAVFSAGHDVFITAEQTREFFARIRSTDKTHFSYPESYHQLLFDLDQPQVVADASAWLLTRRSARSDRHGDR